MNVIGPEHLNDLFAGQAYEAKIVFNDRGAIILPVRHQHRDMKFDGISYEDDYAGNALAAMVRRNAVEIRYHRAFDDKTVARVIGRLLSLPAFSSLICARVTYQGRTLTI